MKREEAKEIVRKYEINYALGMGAMGLLRWLKIWPFDLDEHKDVKEKPKDELEGYQGEIP